jgi:hypothetical protein
MINRSLEALVVAPGTGDEPFIHQDKSIGVNLFGFWRWAYSDLVSNATRGVLAEYIVGLALRCVDGCARVEWDMFDLRTPQGNSVGQVGSLLADLAPAGTIKNFVRHHPH